MLRLFYVNYTPIWAISEIIYETLASASANYSIYELQSFFNGRRDNFGTLAGVPMVLAIKDDINTRKE